MSHQSQEILALTIEHAAHEIGLPKNKLEEFFKREDSQAKKICADFVLKIARSMHVRPSLKRKS